MEDMSEGFLPKEKRKTILLVADDIRTHSGVGTMAREIVINSAKHYNWVCIGAAINHPDQGKRIDLSEDTNKHANLTDASVVIYPSHGYGNPDLIRAVIDLEKPDAMMLFTDPRHFTHIFQMENEIRKKMPLVFLNIWDELPVPHYNFPYYASCDSLIGISKQTININKMVLDAGNVSWKEI